jgi:hypothetical protein
VTGRVRAYWMRAVPGARRIGCNPWFAAATAVVGTFAGFMAAIYSDDIRAAFPFPPAHGPLMWPGHIVAHAVASWSALTAFGLMFGLNSWGVTSTADLQIKALDKQIATVSQSTDELHQVIRTLPPRPFLVSFQDFLVASYPVIVQGLTGDSALQIRDAIVSVLSSLVFMAQRFDGQGKTCTYCANVMLYRDFAGLSIEEMRKLADRAQFCERHSAAGIGWSGVLELRPDLAVFLEHGNTAITLKETLPRFVLEVPQPKEREDVEGRSAVLPGAPEAFCSGSYTYVPDTHLMGDTCRRERGLRPAVSTDMDRYFKEGNGRDVRSFIAIPLLPSRCGAQTNDEPLGVVNIHSDDTEILRSRDGVELFVPMTAPHRLFVAHLIERLLQSEKQAPI